MYPDPKVAADNPSAPKSDPPSGSPAVPEWEQLTSGAAERRGVDVNKAPVVEDSATTVLGCAKKHGPEDAEGKSDSKVTGAGPDDPEKEDAAKRAVKPRFVAMFGAIIVGLANVLSFASDLASLLVLVALTALASTFTWLVTRCRRLAVLAGAAFLLLLISWVGMKQTADDDGLGSVSSSTTDVDRGARRERDSDDPPTTVSIPQTTEITPDSDEEGPVELYVSDTAVSSADDLEVDNLRVTGPHDPVRPGDELVFEYTITNRNENLITLFSTFLAARTPDGRRADTGFSNQGRTLAHNQTAPVHVEMEVGHSGKWRFWPCYALDLTTLCPNNWNEFRLRVE